MRIFIATDIYAPTVCGSAIFTQRLAERLAARGHAVTVAVPSRYWHHERYEQKGVTVLGYRSVPFFVPGFRPALRLGSIGRVRADMQKFGPDVVHLQDHFAVGFMAMKAARKLGVPVAATNHFMPENLVHYLYLPGPLERFLSRMAWRYFRSIYGRADRVTTPTRTAANLLHAVGLQKDVQAISCGIDDTVFHPGPRDEELLKRYGIPTDKPLLLYVGRLDKEKNLDMILRAFAVSRTHVHAQFVIAGKGFEAESLKALANELHCADAVTFTGYVSDADLPGLYRSAHCFAIAGIAELQSIATLEALASGLPAIGIRAMALPELIHDGENGFAFDVGDLDTLSSSIVKIFSDPELRARMSGASLAIAKEHGIERTIDRYEQLYRDLTA
jgi:glycosyltransferase involved in cell wall biosynthesis